MPKWSTLVRATSPTGSGVMRVVVVSGVRGSGVITVAAGVGPVVAVQPVKATSTAMRRRKMQVVLRFITTRLHR